MLDGTKRIGVACASAVLVALTVFSMLAGTRDVHALQGGGGPYDPEVLLRNKVCTLLGGTGGERVQGVWVLPDKRILVTGETTSTDFVSQFGVPPSTPFDQTHNGTRDVYVAIMNEDMTTVEHWTYFGGSDQDRAYFARQDENDNIWVCGFTASPSLPLGLVGNHTLGLQGGFDVFVARFSPDLHDLEVVTRIGGTGNDNPRGTLWVDDVTQAVYVSGGTMSADFPTTIATGVDSTTGSPANSCPVTPCNFCIQATKSDAFVVKLNRANGAIMWSRALGGTGEDNAWGNVRVDSSSNIYIAGCAGSAFTGMIDLVYDYPLAAPTYSSSPVPPWGPADGYVAKLNSDGRVIAFAYVGGSGTDWVAFNDCLELDGQGRPVVTGLTRSTDFPLAGQPLYDRHSLHPSSPDDCDFISNDVFVTKLSTGLNSLVYSSYINGAQVVPGPRADKREEPAGLAILQGYIFITGETDSPGFPVTAGSAFDEVIGASHTEHESCPPPPSCVPPVDVHDSFLVKLWPGVSSPSTLQYGTFFGGDSAGTSADEPGTRGRSLTMILSGTYRGMALFSGQTTSPDFDLLTTPNVVQEAWFSGDDRSGFVAIHDVY